MAKRKEDTLIRDAIAEAKKVREVAMANAKLAIEEAFRPHIATEWSRKLRTEMEDHTKSDSHGTEDGGETDSAAVTRTNFGEPVKEQSVLDSSEIGGGDNKQPDEASKSSSKIDNPGQETDKIGEGAEVESDGHEKVLDQLTEDDEDFDLEDEDEDDGLGLDFGGEDDGDDFDLDGGDETEDLAAIVRELEADVAKLMADQGMGDEGGMDFGGDEFGGEEDDFEVEEDLTDFASRDNVDQTMDYSPRHNPEGEDEEVLRLRGEGRAQLSNEELDEILREMESEDGTDDVVESLRSQVAELKRSVREHRSVVSFLKDRLTEVNMFNAKLLYTNKLFKEHNLNAGDKVRIYETFDRVTTVREAKLVYSALTEVYGTKQPKTKTRSRVMESVASMPVASTKPKTMLNESITTAENDKFVTRMKTLAGLLSE